MKGEYFKMSNIIQELEKEQLRSDLPELEVGDTVRVFVKVIEGTRERLQNFEGVVIKIQGGGVRKSFTVRRISYGVGVERTFPYNSPRIGRIELVRHGVVRRAKLFYLRDLSGKAAKIRERIAFMHRDRAMDGDVRAICALMADGSLVGRGGGA